MSHLSAPIARIRSLIASGLATSQKTGRVAVTAFLAMVASLPAGAGAQSSGDAQASARSAVVGVVTDTQGRAVQGATVSLDVVGGGAGAGAGAGDRRSALTSVHGRFTLPGVPAGPATIRVERLGFAELERSIEIPAGLTIRVDLTLTEQALVLDPLSVVTEQTRIVGDPGRIGAITGAAHLLTAQELERQPNAFGDVHQALRTLPGVYVQDEDGYGLRPNIGLRGTGVERSGRITLMEDGVLAAPAPYASPAAYYFPIAARMEAIEVRTGSSQIMYGPRTIGGAVNLVSSSIPERLSWSADIGAGSESTGRAQFRAGGSHGRFGWLIESFQIGTDGFKQLPTGADTGFRIGDHLAKLRWTSAPGASIGQSLQLKAGVTNQRSDETYLGLTDADFARNPLLRYAGSQNDIMDADHRQLQLRHGLTIGSRFSWTTTAYRNDFARNWYKVQSVGGASIASVLDDPDRYATQLAILRGADSDPGAVTLRANNREYLSTGVESGLGFEGSLGGARHHLRLGLRAHYDHEDRLQWENDYRMSAGRLERTLERAAGSQANRRSEARAWSGYVQDRIEIGRWTLTPGLRWESVEFTRLDWDRADAQRRGSVETRQNDVSAWIPGVGAAFEATPELQLFGGVHRGFAPPGAGASADTEPEWSLNLEAGARWRRRGLALSGTAFRSDYRNILGQATLATGGQGTGEQYNGGAVDIAGLELALDVDPLWGRTTDLRLPLRVTYTLTRAQFASAFESDYDPWGSVEVGDELPYLPSHQFSVTAGLERANWRVDVSVVGNSAMRTMAGQGPVDPQHSTDGFAVASLSAEYRALPRGSVYASVQNLFDERYVTARRPAGTRPGLPRTLLIGYRIAR